MAGTEVGSIFVKIGADIKDLDKGINDSVDGLKKLTDAEIQASKESKETAENLKKLADRAMVDNLKDMASALGGFSSVILDFGKGAMEQALSIGGLENAIVRLSDSAVEGQKTVDFIKNLALTEQEFSTESLLKAGEKLTQFSTNIKELGLTVEDILPKVADFADVQMVDVADASAVVAKALSGTRGGITALGAQYGITTEKLIEYGAAVNNSGEIEDDAIESKRAVIKVLDEFSQRAAIGAQSASEQYENSIAQLNNTFTELKTEIGNEVIPTIIDLVKQGTEVLKWIKDLDPETKKTALTFTAWAGGIALAGQGVTGFLAAAAPFQGVMSSLSAKIVTATGNTTAMGASMGTMGAVLPIVAVGALVIALGALANATIEYQKSITELQKTDIENSLNLQAKAVTELREAFRGATVPQQAFFQVMAEGIKELLKSEEGLKRLKVLLESSVLSEIANTEAMNKLQKEKADLEQQLSNVRSKNKDGDNKILNEQEKQIKTQIADTEVLIKQKQTYIQEMRNERKEIYEAQKAHKDETDAIKDKGKAIEETVGKQKVSEEAMKTYWKNYETIAINEKKTATEKIKTLKDLLNQYNLTDEQRAKVNKEIEKQEAKVTAYLKEQNKERLKDEQETYKKKEDLQKESNQKVLDSNQEILTEQTDQKIVAIDKENKLVEEQKIKTEQVNDAALFLADSIGKVTFATSQAKDEAGGMAEELKKSTEQAKELEKTMVQVGNISATKGSGTPLGMGEFMTPEEAFSNLPGSAPKGGYGHLDNYSNAVRDAMTRETSDGGVYGTGPANNNPIPSSTTWGLTNSGAPAGTTRREGGQSIAPVSQTINYNISVDGKTVAADSEKKYAVQKLTPSPYDAKFN